jgi:hypothetical protein
MSTEQAIMAAINGEDAAIYAYGVIGARSRGARAALARRALTAHRARREALQATIAEPVAAASAYDLPFPVEDAQDAARLAVLVENRMAALLADVAAATADDRRAQAVTGAMESAARAIAWGGAPQAFPHG